MHAWMMAVALAGNGPAERGALEVGTGLRGSMSAFNLSVRAPRFVPHFDIAVGGIAMSALTWVTFVNRDTGRAVSVHPVVVGGTASFGGSGDIVADLVRTYGAFEVLVGTTLTPYDDAFYGTNNLVGSNVTLGGWGTFGVEFLTSEHWAVFVDGGGGFKTLRGPSRNEPYAVAVSWIGSGFSTKIGSRWYF